MCGHNYKYSMAGCTYHFCKLKNINKKTQKEDIILTYW